MKSVLFWVVFFLIGCTQYTFAQKKNEALNNPYIFTSNTLRFSFGLGMNKSQFYSTNGSQLPESKINYIPKFNLDYRFSLGEYYGVSIGGGFGVIPFKFEIPATANTFGFSTSGSGLFGNIKLGLNYQRWISSKYIFRSVFGLGAYNVTNSNSAISSINPNGEINFLISKVNNPGLNPYAFFKVGIDKKLKTDNLIGISLSYERFRKTLYSGSYTINNNAFQGGFENRGHNLTVGINYGFTGVKRKEKLMNLSEKNGLSLKYSRKKIRKDRRYIHPKSILISMKAGVFINRSRIKGDFLQRSDFSTGIFSLNGEIGFRDDYFFQVGLSIKEYVSIVRIDGQFGWGVWNGFFSPACSFGIGKRLIGKNNVNHLNASIGLTLNNNTMDKGIIIEREFAVELDNSIGNAQLTAESKRTFFPSIYMNLSRDFRLTKSLYFTLDYRANLGAFAAHESRVELYGGSADLLIAKKGIVQINGTGQAFQVGVKYKFVPKRYLAP